MNGRHVAACCDRRFMQQPLAWPSKGRDEAIRIFHDDTFRRYFWEESQKLKGAPGVGS